jgi:hypothetical protein
VSGAVTHLMITLTINGAEMKFPLQEFYFTGELGGLWWYDCKMCRAMTQHPAGHLEYHLLKGDYGLTPKDEKDGAGDESHPT